MIRAIMETAPQRPTFIHKGGEYLSRVAKGRSETRLLARAEGVEVIKQLVPKGSLFYLDSADEWQGFEFIYILSGELSYVGTEPPVRLEPKDYIARHLVPERSWFRADEDTQLLYVSSRPAFQVVKQEIEEFQALASQVEIDEHIQGHSRRLERLAVAVGERLGLPPERLADLAYAAFFHDVGKTKVPKEILQKPGELSPEEWEIMKMHPILGREILEQKPFLKNAARIVEQSHERMDGRGYPRGLSGEEICLEARIIAAVDAYDAMTRQRTYRQALSHNQAIAELRAGAGTQFDPQVVEALVEVLSEYEQHSEPTRLSEENARRKQREAFLAIAKSILQGKDIPTLLEQALQGITQLTPFRRAAISVYDHPVPLEATQGARITQIATAGLSPKEEQRLRGCPLTPEQRAEIFRDEFRIGRSYYIPHDRWPWEELPGAVRSASQRHEHATWHPDDILIVPLWTDDQMFVGLISLDDPVDGRMPTCEELEPVEMFASLVALGVLAAKREAELTETVEKLQELSVRDPLTGIYNRRYLEEALEREMARARRERYPIALAMLDLRGFHEVNNRFGHLVGDRVLVQVAQLLAQGVRRSDTVVRYGGDEFILVLPTTPLEEARTVVTRIRRRLKEANFGVPLRLSVRTGVAIWTPEQDRGLEALLAEADAWMYHRPQPRRRRA